MDERGNKLSGRCENIDTMHTEDPVIPMNDLFYPSSKRHRRMTTTSTAGTHTRPTYATYGMPSQLPPPAVAALLEGASSSSPCLLPAHTTRADTRSRSGKRTHPISPPAPHSARRGGSRPARSQRKTPPCPLAPIRRGDAPPYSKPLHGHAMPAHPQRPASVVARQAPRLRSSAAGALSP